MFSQTSEARTQERLRAPARTTSANSAADRAGRARIPLVASNAHCDFSLGPAPGEDGCHQPGATVMNWFANALGVVLGLGTLGWLAGLI